MLVPFLYRNYKSHYIHILYNQTVVVFILKTWLYTDPSIHYPVVFTIIVHFIIYFLIHSFLWYLTLIWYNMVLLNAIDVPIYLYTRIASVINCLFVWMSYTFATLQTLLLLSFRFIFLFICTSTCSYTSISNLIHTYLSTPSCALDTSSHAQAYIYRCRNIYNKDILYKSVHFLCSMLIILVICTFIPGPEMR